MIQDLDPRPKGLVTKISTCRIWKKPLAFQREHSDLKRIIFLFLVCFYCVLSFHEGCSRFLVALSTLSSIHEEHSHFPVVVLKLSSFHEEGSYSFAFLNPNKHGSNWPNWIHNLIWIRDTRQDMKNIPYLVHLVHELFIFPTPVCGCLLHL